MDFEIKLIQVDGMFKALVLDMNKTENRLAYIAENADKDLAYNDAAAFIIGCGSQSEAMSVCH